MSKIKLSIIVVKYRAEEEFKRCLKELPQRADWEIIVVDNDTENRGYGRGCNWGVRKAKGEFVLFLNPDTWIKETAIQKMLQRIEMDKQCGMVGPKLTNEKGDPIQTVSKQPNWLTAPVVFSALNKWWPSNPISRKYWLCDLDLSHETWVENLSGACFLMRKSDYILMGGFDERFFMYWEDNDLCIRVRQVLKKKILFYPQASGIHLGAASTNKKDFKINQAFRKSRLYFFSKWYGWGQAWGLNAWLGLGENWRLMAILGLAGFLRFDRLAALMPFIPDQGRDYWEAYQAIESGKIPWLGMPSSLPYFKQGPLYVWWLILWFSLTGFTVEVTGYLAALMSWLAVAATYRLVERKWGQLAASLAGLILATSPLAVTQGRMAFMTNPIPLVTVIWLGWLLGKKNKLQPFFIGLGFGWLFQFELASFPLISLIGLDIWQKRTELGQIFSWWKYGKRLVLGLLIGLAPQFSYDLFHGFKQMGLFVGWVGYRMVRFTGLWPGSESGGGRLSETIKVIGSYLTRFSSWDNVWVLALYLGIILYGGRNLRQRQLIYWYSFIGVVLSAYLIHGAPSEAYFPVLLVPLACVVGISISQMKNTYLKSCLTLAVLMIALINAYRLQANDYWLYTPKNIKQYANLPYGMPLLDQKLVVREIVRLTQGHEINLEARGPGSEFLTYLDNWKFLLATEGVKISDKGQKVILFFGETANDYQGTDYRIREVSGLYFGIEP